MREVQDSRFRWGTVAFNNPLSIRLDGETSPIGISPDSLVDPSTLLVGDRVWCQLVAKRVVVIGTAKGGSTPWVAVTLGSIGGLGGSGASQHHVRRLAGGLVEIALDLAVSDQGDMLVNMPDWATPSGANSIRYAAAITGGAAGSSHIDISTAGTARIFGPSGNFPTWAALNAVYSRDRP